MEKSEEKNKKYESPSTKRTQVEMEGNLCGSIDVVGDNEKSVNIAGQEVISESGNDFSNDPWGEISTTPQN